MQDQSVFCSTGGQQPALYSVARKLISMAHRRQPSASICSKFVRGHGLTCVHWTKSMTIFVQI